MPGRHRSPPPAPRTDWRWHTIAALAGLGILAPPVTLWAEAGTADATAARTQVSTVTRAERTTAGPLATLSIGVVAPAIESLYPEPSAAPGSTARGRGVTRIPQTTPEEPQQALGAITGTPEQTVTPAPQPVTDEAADTPTTEAPSPDPAAVPEDSATPTEEEPVETPEPTVDVDVTGEVSAP